jgi:Leucine rich repeat
MRISQTRMRSLMVVFAMLVSGISRLSLANDVEQERAVAAIEKLGGKVERDLTSPGHLVVRVDLRMTGVTDTDLASLGTLKSLQSLSLSCTGITDAGLAHLEGLANLRRLDLDVNRITDAGLVHLEGLANLRRLDLRFTKVTIAGAERLQRKLPKMVIDQGDDKRIMIPPSTRPPAPASPLRPGHRLPTRPDH